MGPRQAALFDLDGTLVDSEVLWVEAIGAALSQRGLPVTSEDMARLVYGHAWPDIYREIEREHPGIYPSRAAMEAVTVPLFRDLSCRRDIRIQPSIDLLKRLSCRMPVAVVSGSTRSRVEETLGDLGLKPYVKLFVGCEDVPVGKPDPSGFLLAARILAVPAAGCVVFEDSAAGVAAAKAAGMRCVALLRGNAVGQDLSAADLVLTSLAEFDETAPWPGAE
jgi:sugar-phosphatase